MSVSKRQKLLNPTEETFSDKTFTIDESEILTSSILPNRPDYNLRWTERIGSFYLPNTSFIFELSYPHPFPVDYGFSLNWQYLQYSKASFDRTVLYCVVKDVKLNLLSTVIYPGDIVLKVNETQLIYKPGDEVDDKKLSNQPKDLVSDQNQTNVVFRIFRPGGQLSVMELLLYSQEKTVNAKISVKMLIKSDQPSLGLDFSVEDKQLPISAKKMLLNQKFNWVSIPNLPPGSAQANAVIATATTSNGPQTNIGPGTYAFYTPTASVHSNSQNDPTNSIAKEGVLKDRNKYIAIFVDPKDPNQFYNLGRFDTEDEAKKSIQKAKSLVEETGVFILRQFQKGLKKKEVPPPQESININLSSLVNAAPAPSVNLSISMPQSTSYVSLNLAAAAAAAANSGSG